MWGKAWRGPRGDAQGPHWGLEGPRAQALPLGRVASTSALSPVSTHLGTSAPCSSLSASVFISAPLPLLGEWVPGRIKWDWL